MLWKKNVCLFAGLSLPALSFAAALYRVFSGRTAEAGPGISRRLGGNSGEHRLALGDQTCRSRNRKESCWRSWIAQSNSN